jgi:hypothetical protein
MNLTPDELMADHAIPEAETNRFMQVVGNRSIALLDPTEATHWLEGHQLHATAKYFADHSLDGVDMLYMAPEDLDNDGTVLLLFLMELL